MTIDAIKPAVFDNLDEIRAFFTLKNKDFGQDEASIKGLNIGYNTEEDPEIVTRNRRKILHEFGIDSNWVAFANQVHSNRVLKVTEGGTFAKTDALVTQVPGLALAIQVADCGAVLIADPKSQIIAAAHAGWRGAAGDIVPRTLKKMDALGAELHNCFAFISPCISAENFEVGHEVAEQFPEPFVDAHSYKKPHVDLKGYLAHQLTSAGVKQSRIEVHPGCTIMQAEQYYSYRREKDKSGRMMALIQLKER